MNKNRSVKPQWSSYELILSKVVIRYKALYLLLNGDISSCCVTIEVVQCRAWMLLVSVSEWFEAFSWKRMRKRSHL
jgi:hypothetical protein